MDCKSIDLFLRWFESNYLYNQLLINIRINMKQSSSLFFKKLFKIFPQTIIYMHNNELFIMVRPEWFTKFVYFIKKHTALQFEQMIDITAVDYAGNKHRFELGYQFLSILFNQRITVVVRLTELDQFDSISSLYSSAEWYEREVWDMFGIYFYNNKDFRRMLSNYGFVGHPLRKDFPVVGYTVEVTPNLEVTNKLNFNKWIQNHKIILFIHSIF